MTDAPSTIDGLYVHVPFCSSVCPYCDFAVTVGRRADRAAYVDLLLAEAALVDEVTGPYRTLYLGGGTPSILPPDALGRLLAGLRERFGERDDARVSLEANPEDVTPDSLAAWRALGVHTLSLGVQSFDDDSLRFLGRRHRGAEATAAVEAALDAGFPVVSVDLIFGLPDRPAAALEHDLERIARLAPQHVSGYQLTIHEGTPFGRRAAAGELREADEPTQSERYTLLHDRLAAAGYEPYEVSNFARDPASRSRHNLGYWRHRPYLGFGPSAHSFVEPRRWWNRRGLDDWRDAVEAGRRPIAGDERLTPAQLALEAVMLGLRTVDGVDLDEIERRWGVSLWGANRARIEAMVRDRLVEARERRLVPTRAGLAVADGLARSFEVPGG